MDVLIGWSSNVCPILARQTTELGFDKPIIMNAAFAGQDVLDSLPQNLRTESMRLQILRLRTRDEAVKEFVEKFEAAYGKTPVGDRECSILWRTLYVQGCSGKGRYSGS